MTKRMDHSVVDRALKALGERVQYHAPIELLLVGGAAGMLTGVLGHGRTTLDCDVMVSEPGEALVVIEL